VAPLRLHERVVVEVHRPAVASAPRSASSSSRTPREPELQLLHRLLDTWAGIGLIATGMQRQGWDLQLTTYGTGDWRATFWVTGVAHSISGGSAWRRRRGWRRSGRRGRR